MKNSENSEKPAEATVRVCPGCGADVVAVNVIDHEDGSVTFDCGKCGAKLHDNAERTNLTAEPKKKPKS